MQPPRTYQSSENIVYHLTHDPAYSLKTINEVAQLYNIPDLPSTVGAFIFRITTDPSKGFIDSVGGRRNILQDNLPVSHLQIWSCASKTQPITILTTSLFQTPSMQHLHLQPGLMANLILWFSTLTLVKIGRRVGLKASGEILISSLT